jgi:soluble lytic murein transglycosylase-like protein
MSVASVVSRVQELEALVRPPAPPAAPMGVFAAQLSSAQGAAGLGSVPAAAAPVAGGATPYDAQITAAAAKYGLDPALLKGLIRQESNFDPNAGSPAGAQGLAQLMPGTAAALGVTNPKDPAQAIEGGAKYLRQQLDAFGGDVPKALAAYNAGPGAVTRYGGVPPYAETQNYVRQVQAYAAGYRSAAPAAAASALPTPFPLPTTT